MFPAISLSRNSAVEQRRFNLLSTNSTQENVSRNSAVPQFRSGTTENLSAFNQFRSRKCFPHFRCPAIPQWNNGNFICFQSVSVENMFPAIPQRNNGNYPFSMGNISRLSAVPFFRILVAPEVTARHTAVLKTANTEQKTFSAKQPSKNG